MRDGPVQFDPCKQVESEDLVKKFGQPDEIGKLTRSAPGGDPANAPAPWKIYVWGHVQVIVDETGLSRYFAVIKPK